jgi:hypothetical protein
MSIMGKKYNRDRARRERAEWLHSNGVHYDEGVRKTAENRRDALYDPLRDGYLPHSDMTAQLMGDPPIGRRAIDG